MTSNELIALYIEAYETGANDLKSLNKWLKELNVGVRLKGRNGKITKVEAA